MLNARIYIWTSLKHNIWTYIETSKLPEQICETIWRYMKHIWTYLKIFEIYIYEHIWNYMNIIILKWYETNVTKLQKNTYLRPLFFDPFCGHSKELLAKVSEEFNKLWAESKYIYIYIHIVILRQFRPTLVEAFLDTNPFR